MPLLISGIIPVNLSQLNDVNIAAPVSGQYLRYSGTIWQNSYLNSDVFNYLNTSLTSTNGVTLDFSIPNNISIGLASVNPTSGTFGSASAIPVFTVDNQGRITNITTATSSGAASAAVLATARNISSTGDAAWAVLFDGSANVTSPLTLATVNAAPQVNTFQKITVNGKGLVTATTAVTPGDITTALAFTPVNKAGDTMTGELILNADPTLPLGAVTKQYADTIASGVNIHASCETATSSALASCTYANGIAGVGATLTATAPGVLGTIGGYASLTIGSRILVKDQVAQLQNGIYAVSDLGTVSTPWVLTRTTDFDGAPTFEISAGDLTYISEGTYNGTQWVQTSVGTGVPGDYIIVGTNSINFTQFSGPSTYLAGTGISISVSTISNTGVTSLIAGSNVSISGSTGDVTISTTGTVPTSTTAANLAGGAVGSIPYQTSSGATAMLAVGSGVLVGGITPSYSTSPTLIGTNFSGTASALSIGGNAATVTTNANLSGIVTSIGNATSIADGAIANAKLANSSVTIGTTSISLGTSTLTLSGLTSVSATTFTGSGSGLASIPNSALVGNGSFALGSTAISLGSTITNVSGLTSVSATTFSGALTGNASTASGSSGNIFLTAGTGAVGTENDIGAQCNGYNAAYLYNNSTAWGLYSVTGGSIIYWNRGSSVVTIGSNLTVSGSVTATSLNATSTKRVKKAIKNLSNKYLSRFSDLKPREYDRKDYVAHEFGFIAEEMALVYPEIVGIDNTGIPSGIDYGKLSTILTAKIQEQQKTIDKLQNQMLIVMGMLKDLRNDK